MKEKKEKPKPPRRLAAAGGRRSGRKAYQAKKNRMLQSYNKR